MLGCEGMYGGILISLASGQDCFVWGLTLGRGLGQRWLFACRSVVVCVWILFSVGCNNADEIRGCEYG